MKVLELLLLGVGMGEMWMSEVRVDPAIDADIARAAAKGRESDRSMAQHGVGRSHAPRVEARAGA